MSRNWICVAGAERRNRARFVFGRGRCFLLMLIVSLGGYRSLWADLISVADFVAPAHLSGYQNNVVGWVFTPNQPLEVVRLGYFDQFGNGLAENHQVGLWRVNTSGPSHTLLASTTVPAGTAAVLEGLYRFQDIASVMLTAGQQYVVGGHTGTTQNDFVVQANTGVTHISEISLPEGRILFNAMSLAPPTEFGESPSFPYFGPMLQVQVTAVPEPSSAFLAFACLGGVGTWYTGRRWRSRVRR